MVDTSINISEFASRIGVSVTTVSRAISGRGRVSPATREKVLQSMKELGYAPNLHAQQLVTGRSHMVLLHATGVEVEFTIRMAEGIQRVLRENGYGLLLDTMSGLNDNDSLLDTWVRSRAVDGVIVIVGAPDTDGHNTWLSNPQTPVVTIGYPVESSSASLASTVWSLDKGAYEVADVLVKLGHKKIGFIDVGSSDPLLGSFRGRLSENGVNLDDSMIITAEGLDVEDGANAMRKLLSRPIHPSAVFARNDTLALGALQEAKRHRLRVPDDISIVGHDNLPLVKYADTPLTTVHVDCIEMGRTGAEMLLKMINEPAVVPVTYTVPCTSLVMRKTLGPAHAD